MSADYVVVGVGQLVSGDIFLSNQFVFKRDKGQITNKGKDGGAVWDRAKIAKVSFSEKKAF